MVAVKPYLKRKTKVSKIEKNAKISGKARIDCWQNTAKTDTQYQNIVSFKKQKSPRKPERRDNNHAPHLTITDLEH